MTIRLGTLRGRRVTGPVAITWLVTTLLIIAVWGAVTELARRDQQEALARAERDSGSLAQIVAGQAERAFADTDRILNFLAYDLVRLGGNRPDLKDMLKNAIRGSDLLLQLAYTNASGELVETSVDGATAKVSIADREHFLVHKTRSVTGLFISKPVFGRATGKWSIQLSRRITTEDGSFAGVMVASLDPFYFGKTFQDLDVGGRGLAGLVGRDGILRARTGMDEHAIGLDLSDAAPFRAAMAQPRGFMRTVSPIEGGTRLLSFRVLQHYPLIVYASFDEREFLATTWELQRIYVVGGGVLTVMLLAMALLMSWHMRTQIRAREAAERANHMKSEFLATISHEIRTPMNGVLGMLALLEGDALTPKQQRQVDLARRSAEGLLVLLDDILDFSKLEAGKTRPDPGNCEPAKIIAAVIELLRPKAAEKGLSLSTHMGSSVPDVVVTDPTRLRQILFNLVGNAIKFTASGYVNVRVQRGADLPGGRFMLEFEVEDSGIGIPPEVLPNLFRQFSQADSSITRAYGGTGLGLAICKRLCELLDGSITVSSTSGKGSLFRFTIPVAIGEAAASPAASPPVIALPPLRILVVDDNAVNLQVVEGLLSQAGHQVTAVASGQAAIDAVQVSENEAPNVVLMDVQMPEMDGLTATRLIRSLRPPSSKIPVIALTAHASNSSRAVCIEAGMNGFIIKPAGLHRMQQEIAAVLHLEPAQPPQPAVPVATDALLDRELIAELTSTLCPDAWERIVAALADSVEQEIARIEAALEAGESPARSAHTLKGMAWNTGAANLANLAKQLETAAPDEAKRLADKLRVVAQQTLAALQACMPAVVEA